MSINNQSSKYLTAGEGPAENDIGPLIGPDGQPYWNSGSSIQSLGAIVNNLASIPAGVVGPVYDTSGNLAFGNGSAVVPRGTRNRGRATIIPFGSLDSTNTPTASTVGLAMPIPIKYNAVRIGYMHMGASGVGATAGTSLIVAQSDDMGLLDYTYDHVNPGNTTLEFRKFVEPHISGIKYNTIVASGNPGWKQVTFAGASTVNIPAPATGVVSVTWSDLITLEGVADINNSTVFPLLIRLYHGTGAYTRPANLTGILVGTNARTDLGKLAPKQAIRTNTNVVATPSDWTTASTPWSSDSTWPPLAIELYTEGRLVTVGFIGDTRFSLSSELFATKRYLSAPIMLQNILTARGINMQLQQISGVALSAAEYLSRALSTLAANNRPDYLVYLLWSVNPGGQRPTAANVNSAKVLLHQFLDACYARQTIPIVLTAFPSLGGWDATEFALLNGLETYCRNMGLAVISPLRLLGTTSNGDWAPGMSFDTNHASQAGYQALAAEIARHII